MFERFFTEEKDFKTFKADWSVECKDYEDRQRLVDTLISECVPERGERVLFALVLLYQAVKPLKPFEVAVNKARYLRNFYDHSSNQEIKNAFLYLVKRGAFIVTYERPKRLPEQLPVGPESSSANIHERLLFLKSVLQASPNVSSKDLASLKTLLARYQESKLLSTCPLSAATSEDFTSIIDELSRTVASLESFCDSQDATPLPRTSVRSRFTISNPVLPASELRRSKSAPPQRKRQASTLRSTTPPLESISNMPDIQF